MRRIVVLIIILLAVQSKAQQFQLSGRVQAAEGQEALIGSHITVEELELGTVTNEYGLFSLLMDSAQYDGFYLVCRYLGFETQRIHLVPNLMISTDEGYFILIQMIARSYALDPIPISSERLPEVVYASMQHSIADYEFLDEQIILLAYEKRLEKASKLYLVNMQGSAIDSLDIPQGVKAIGFKRDYADLVYLEAVGKIYQVEVGSEGLSLHRVDKDTYDEQVAPVVDTIGTQVFFSTWMEQFPAFDYYRYDLVDSQYTHIRKVADAFMLELCRADFKYLTTRDKLRMYRLELETGVQKEVLTCMSTFQEGLYYDPIYAPMFVTGDSLLLFDHPGERLFVFDTQGAALDSIPINYHRPDKVMGNEFTQELVMDEKTGAVYAIFQRPGGACRLQRIDISTGRIQEAISLVYDYPSAIQVRDNEVYYTYRPFESSQKKYLYKESIARR